MVMKKSVEDPVVTRRPRGAGPSNALHLLADVAASVDACGECGGFCGHSDLGSCFSTVTKRKKEAFFQGHHSLFLRRSRKPPLKRRRLCRSRPSPSTALFPTPDDFSVHGVRVSETVGGGAGIKLTFLIRNKKGESVENKFTSVTEKEQVMMKMEDGRCSMESSANISTLTHDDKEDHTSTSTSSDLDLSLKL